MKRLIFPVLLLFLLTACRTQVEIRPDTIVDIPLNPTQPTVVTEPATEKVTAKPTEAPTETLASKPTEPPTEKPTEKPGEKPAKKPSKETTPTEKPTQAPTEPPTQAPTQTPTLPTIQNYTSTELDLEIMETINAARVDAGFTPLVILEPLSTVAAKRCVELNLDWKHTRPDGTPFTTALTEAGLVFSDAEEIVYGSAGDPDSQTVVEKWMSSKAHRDDLLLESARYIGAANLEFDGLTTITVLIMG